MQSGAVVPLVLMLLLLLFNGAVASHQEGPQLEFKGLFCVELACSACVYVGFCWVLSPIVQKHACYGRFEL